MLSFDEKQAAVVAADSKKYKWSFLITDKNGAKLFVDRENHLYNGFFDTDSLGWIPVDCTITSVSKYGCLTATGGASQLIRATASDLTIGNTYTFSLYVKSGTSGDENFSASIQGLATVSISGTTSGVWTKYEKEWIADADSAFIFFEKQSATIGTMLLDTVLFSEKNTAVLRNFSGIELRRNNSEENIIAPAETSFILSNKDYALSHEDLKGGTVLIRLYLSNADYTEVKIAGWLFKIKSAMPDYQDIRISCVDFLQEYLEGDYPNTPMPEELFPSNRNYTSTGLCIPVSFGTAYIPLRDIVIDNAVVVTADTISVVASASGSRGKFVDSASGFAAIERGRTITSSGFANPENNISSPVLFCSAATIEVEYDVGLVTEAAGSLATISHQSSYIMLGTSDYDYTITKVRSPRSCGNVSEYSSASYTFSQFEKADAATGATWTMFQAIIVDLDNDGTMDAAGFFGTGDPMLDPLVEFSCSNTASITNPSWVIDFVIKDFGVGSDYIASHLGNGESFETMSATFASWGLSFEGAFWNYKSRRSTLSSLLNMSHSCVDVGEMIDLRILSKASRATITTNEVIGPEDGIGKGEFSYSDITNSDYSDSIYVAWQQAGQPQDSFLKVLVACDAAANVIPKDIFECPFVSDSQNIQRIGRLKGQRMFFKEGEGTISVKALCLGLQPDDVVTLDGDEYGGTAKVLLDGVRINPNLILDLSFSKHSVEFDDWEDLTPDALVIPTDQTPYTYTPTISGPSTDKNIGRSAFDVWGKEWLKVGPIANAGQFTDFQKAMNAVKQAGGGAIYILNGTYELPKIYVPDVPLEIVGQSQGGVILKNTAGSDLFVLHNLTKTFSFKQFSVESQNTSTFSKMFYVYGDTTAENICSLDIGGISALLAESNNEFLCYGHTGELGKISLYDSTIQNGIGMHTLNCAEIIVSCSRNKFNSCYLGLIANESGSLFIKNNVFIDCASPVSINESLRGGSISGNEIRGNYTSPLSAIVIGSTDGLGTVNGIVADFNIIEVESTASVHGIGTNHCSRVLLLNNQIKITTTEDTFPSNGIGAAYFSDGSISKNSITIDSPIGGSGIVLTSTSSRNVIGGNNINRVNNTANDYGIQLYPNCNNNQGGDNITYNCGTGIVDSGTGNAVTGKDI